MFDVNPEWTVSLWFYRHKKHTRTYTQSHPHTHTHNNEQLLMHKPVRTINLCIPAGLVQELLLALQKGREGSELGRTFAGLQTELSKHVKCP